MARWACSWLMMDSSVGESGYRRIIHYRLEYNISITISIVNYKQGKRQIGIDFNPLAGGIVP